MDVASILLAAGAVLGTKAIEESTKLAVGSVWSALKSMIAGRRDGASPALEVIDVIERLPADTPPTPELVTRIEALRLADDPGIAALMQRLESLLVQRAPVQIKNQVNIHGGNFPNMTFN